MTPAGGSPPHAAGTALIWRFGIVSQCRVLLDASPGVEGNVPRYSSRSSANCLRSYLQRDSGGSSDGSVDWNLGLSLGGNGACYSARNPARSCPRCLPGCGPSSCGNNPVSNLPRSSGGAPARDLESSVASYGVGIGGGRAAGEDRGLKIEDLGRKSAVGGMCAIIHIQEVEYSSCALRRTHSFLTNSDLSTGRFRGFRNRMCRRRRIRTSVI